MWREGGEGRRRGGGGREEGREGGGEEGRRGGREEGREGGGEGGGEGGRRGGRGLREGPGWGYISTVSIANTFHPEVSTARMECRTMKGHPPLWGFLPCTHITSFGVVLGLENCATIRSQCADRTDQLPGG